MTASPPPPPKLVEETGLDAGFLLDLLCKNIYRLGHETQTAMATELNLLPPVVDELIEQGREARLIQPIGVRSASMTAEMRYELTDAGRAWAAEALRQSEYIGAAPVPLHQYVDQVARQSIRGEVITRDMLLSVLSELTLTDEVKDAIGPAANSGKSMLLYGPPGNGKSSIAVSICSAFRDVVFIPYAVELDRQVITLYDNTVHRRVPLAAQDPGLRQRVGFDKRFAVCRRPVVITGGELTLDMLDLSFNPVTHIYEAPLQMKAASGVFVIDDFGRQREQPQSLINRWIVPLEQGVDYLTLQTGRKFEAPFDTLVIFSTNIPPRQLVDDAALRRIRHKIEVGRPDRDMFIRILITACQRQSMPITEGAIAYLLTEFYARDNEEFAAFHAEFLIEQVKAIAAYEDVKPEIRAEFMSRAWRNLFTTA